MVDWQTEFQRESMLHYSDAVLTRYRADVSRLVNGGIPMSVEEAMKLADEIWELTREKFVEAETQIRLKELERFEKDGN